MLTVLISVLLTFDSIKSDYVIFSLVVFRTKFNASSDYDKSIEALSLIYNSSS